MKTIEQATEEYAEKYCLNNSEHKRIFAAGFRVCAKEFSQRWIPVEEGLPGKADYDRCLWKNDSRTWFGIARESDKPTHWRPIEIK